MKNLLWLATVLPFVYGCNSGGGGGSVSGFFGDSGSGSIGSLSSGVGGGAGEIIIQGGSASELAVIHNPEPASMLLLSGGLMAMAYYKNKIKNTKI